MGTPRTPAGPRSRAHTSLHTAAPLALGPGGPTGPAPAAGGRAPPGRLRHPGYGHAGAGPGRLADQHGRHRARPPVDPPAWGGRWAAWHHAGSARGGLVPAAGLVSYLVQLRCAAGSLMPAAAAPLADHRPRRGPDVAALDPGDGGGTDRPGR